jgi:hypothetical protein
MKFISHFCLNQIYLSFLNGSSTKLKNEPENIFFGTDFVFIVNIMKKLLFLVFSIFFYINITSAQMTEVVDANAYCNNPKKYNGRTITIKNVILKSSSNNSTPNAVTPVGAAKANTPCTPPKGYKYLNIEFPNPTFDGCFVMPMNMTPTLFSGRDLRVTITFKADSNLHNTISNLQVQP